jgi:nicotinate-nucleotide adenylyltransferase
MGRGRRVETPAAQRAEWREAPGGPPRAARGGEPRLARGDEPRAARGEEPRAARGGEPRVARGGERSRAVRRGEPRRAARLDGNGGIRLGIMGGTFDPIHHGHLVAASEVAHAFDLDEVVFVPTGQPWEKEELDVSPAEDRYLMTVIATASNPRFSVSRVDIDRPGLTYTIDTLRDLRAARGGAAELFFITGADALARLMSWRDADELVTLAHFVGCTRPGHALSGHGLPEGKASLIEIPALAISSTGCRERVRSGEPIWYLVPDGIVQYIAKRRLYLDD